MFPRLRLIGRRLRGTNRSVCNGFHARGFSRRRANPLKSLICRRFVVLYNERVIPLSRRILFVVATVDTTYRGRGVITDVVEVLYFF